MSSATSYKRDIEDVDSTDRSKRIRKSHPTKKLTHNDYAFGWVAALPEELAAARAMLDERHLALAQRNGDSNIYTLGSMGDHNIVIAGLPSDGYGTVNAATVANNMHRTFPSVRDFLMVGIAGGAGTTGNFDVRLGDIVVGDILIQYDLKKDLFRQAFEIKAIPLRPSERLRHALSELRAVHEEEESRVPTYIRRIADGKPKMKKYSIRPAQPDLLFEDSYDHVGPNDNCDACDLSKLVERGRRENDDPIVHYGVVASGNSLIKDPERRNELVERHRALCFEMEGAGIIGSLQCLVVRSICDYADSHKNKLWQPYAAAAAAAYAKELVLAIPISEDQESRMTRDRLSSDNLEVLMDSLSFENIISRELNIKPPHGNTCEWILDHDSYLTWLNLDEHPRHHGFLWIRGKPGAGKSTLMKFIYTKMKENSITVSFFFNARGSHLEKSTEGMYRSLLLQLLQRLTNSQQEQVFAHYPLLPRAKEGPMKWDVGILQDLLRNAISQFAQQELLCFVDALDECHEDDVYDMVEYFENLGELASEANVTLLICLSSRHYPSITIKDGITITLEDQAGHSRDLEQYVTNKLDVGAKNAPGIRATLLRKAAGVFMWVVLVVNILNKEHQRGRIFAVKKRLSEIPDKLGALFKDMLKRDNENMNEFKLSIQWILFASEPLNPQEYYYAMLSGLDHEQSDLGGWDTEEITKENMEQYVLTSSKGLAEVTKTTTIPDVQFIHESVRDFLLKDGGINEIWLDLQWDFQSYSHNKLKQCCYTYMKARAIDAAAVETIDYSERKATLQRFPFITFAVTSVAYHSRHAAASVSQHCFLEAFDFQTWGRLWSLNTDHLGDQLCDDLIYFLTDQSPIGCCETKILSRSTIDCCKKLPLALERPFYPEQTALMLAIAEWREDLIEMLLDRGAEIDRKNKTGQTPLFYAIEWMARDRDDRGDDDNYNKVLQLLLNRGADIHVQDTSGRTPLLLAAQKGVTEAVELLLDKGSDVTDVDGDGATALYHAAAHAETEMVHLLLARGSDINAANNDGSTPLHQAAAHSHPETVRVLLNLGANVNAVTKNGIPPLHEAVTNRLDKTVLRLLLSHGAQVTTANNEGSTLLHMAVSEGFDIEVFQLLLKHGAQLDRADNNGRTPLHIATELANKTVLEIRNRVTDTYGFLLPHGPPADRFQLAVIRLLFSHGAQSNAVDNNGRTPLHVAAGCTAFASRLGSRTIYDRSPLVQTIVCRPGETAPARLNKQLIHLLLEHGARAHVADNDGKTPLHLAAEGANRGAFRLLLHEGAQLNALDKNGMTPLQLAEREGHATIVELCKQNTLVSIDEIAGATTQEGMEYRPLYY